MRRVWAFVIVLECSRYMFMRPVLTMDQWAWTQCHVEAFASSAGVPLRLVNDNLKTGPARLHGPVGLFDHLGEVAGQ